MRAAEAADASAEVGRLSPLEERFERARRRWGLLAGPAVALAVYFWWAADYAPAPRRLATVLALVVIYWVSEAIPIPVTALLGPALCALLGIGSARAVLAPFADPVIFVFLGSFLLARAMMVNGLERRVALRVLALPGVGSSPTGLLVATGGVAAVLSMWISNTGTTAMLFPIVLGIISTLEALGPAGSGRALQRYGTGLLLMTAYAASIGGLATPVGTPPNLIGLGMMENLVGRRIPFFEWMLLNLPLVVVMFAFLAVLFRVLEGSRVERFRGLGERLGELRAGLGRWTRAQTFTLVAFLTTVSLWVLPGILTLALGREHAWAVVVKEHLHEAVAALLGPALLFLLPVDWRQGKFALTWREAVQIDWGTILLFGGGLSLGGLMYETGLARAWAESLLAASGLSGVWGITALAIAFAILMSETTSNTASASMVVPVAIVVAQAAGVSPLPPALGATLGASFGFMLPVSTPPNAIVYGSGRIPLLAMMRAGVLVDIAGFFVVWGTLRVLCPLLGLL
ncbi:MAG: SLC13 family permease [Terriglobia bacterium]